MRLAFETAAEAVVDRLADSRIGVFARLRYPDEWTLLIDGAVLELRQCLRVVRSSDISEFAVGIEERLTLAFPHWYSDLVGERHRWLRLMLRDPASSQRPRPASKTRIDLSARDIEELDGGVRVLVEEARERGLPTMSSCAGHNGAPGHLDVLGGRRAAQLMMAFLHQRGVAPGFLSLSSRFSADKSKRFRMATVDFWLPLMVGAEVVTASSLVQRVTASVLCTMRPSASRVP